MLNSESIVIIRIKGEHLLYNTISGGMIGYGWGNVCYIVNFSPGEYLLYSKVSGGKVYYIANIPRGNVYFIVNITGEGLLCGRFTIRHRHWCLLQIILSLFLKKCTVFAVAHLSKCALLFHYILALMCIAFAVTLLVLMCTVFAVICY